MTRGFHHILYYSRKAFARNLFLKKVAAVKYQKLETLYTVNSPPYVMYVKLRYDEKNSAKHYYIIGRLV